MDISEQKKRVETELRRLEVMSGGFGKRILGVRDSAFTRYPLVFVLLSSFGLVATFYGFEKVIDNIAIFANNPWIILGTGIGILILTGTLFKKLS